MRQVGTGYLEEKVGELVLGFKIQVSCFRPAWKAVPSAAIVARDAVSGQCRDTVSGCHDGRKHLPGRQYLVWIQVSVFRIQCADARFKFHVGSYLKPESHVVH